MKKLSIKSEVIKLLYASSIKSLVVSSIIAALLVFLQADAVKEQTTIAWLVILMIGMGIKKAIYFYFIKHPEKIRSDDTWLNLFRITALIAGASWGTSAFFFYHPNDYLHQAFLAMCIAAICGGAIVFYAIDKLTSLAFLIGLSILFLPHFLGSGDNLSIAIGLMFLTFVLYITLAGFNLAHTLYDNILLRLSTHESKEEINALAQRQKLHFDNTPLAVIEWDKNFKVTSWNIAAEKMFGYDAHEAKEQHISFIVPTSQQALMNNTIKQLLIEGGGNHSRNQNVKKDGKIIYCEWFNTTLKDRNKQIVGFASLIQDETAYKTAQEEIERLAYYDPLTNMPNRRLLGDRLNQSLKASRRNKSSICVMFMDLDNFKTLNDSKGHAVGDLLLQKVSKRLEHTLRSHDTVARIGGDEFVLIVENLGRDPEAATISATHIANKILKEINRPFVLNDYKHFCTPSIGICMYSGENINADEVLKRADTAMYQVKQLGRNNFKFYDESMQPMLDLLANLKNDLNLALAQKELELHYQMQVNEDLEIIGAEALLRWHHSELGEVSPSKFIPLAEESGLIIPIGHWVLQQACQQLKKWNDAPRTQHLRLSVNVSALQFAQSDFVSQVAKAINQSQCNPKQLMLELTESLVVRNIKEVVDKMKALKEMGVLLSMDDFGMGYSSLSVLKKLPLDELKIDQSFVADALDSADNALIIQTIIAMGSNLGLEVIAEGVATKEQANFLNQAGCKTYQGYLFGKPVNVSAFESTKFKFA
jgi:diguanylate cyclase (GGDEF)-like protein/PAS domain S-box-containing protein